MLYQFPRRVIAVCLIICSFLARSVRGQSVSSIQGEQPRERISIDRGWHFALGNAVDVGRDFGFATNGYFKAKAAYGDRPASMDFDDHGWRTVDLPHDWAVELPFDPRSDIGHGAKPIGLGY